MADFSENGFQIVCFREIQLTFEDLYSWDLLQSDSRNMKHVPILFVEFYLFLGRRKVRYFKFWLLKTSGKVSVIGTSSSNSVLSLVIEPIVR